MYAHKRIPVAVLFTGVLTGCPAQEVSVRFDQPGCTDYDFNNPAEEVYSVEVTGGGEVVATHSYTIQTCDTSFEPEVTVEDKVITVREFWLEGSGTDCETCFSPEVVLTGVPRGSYELRWFIGDEDYPALVDEFQVD